MKTKVFGGWFDLYLNYLPVLDISAFTLSIIRAVNKSELYLILIKYNSNHYHIILSK